MRIRTTLLASAAILALSLPAFAQADPHHPDATIEPDKAESNAPVSPEATTFPMPEGCPPAMMMSADMNGMAMMEMLKTMELTQKAMIETMQLMREEMERPKEGAAP
jgi:hypothetical protein